MKRLLALLLAAVALLSVAPAHASHPQRPSAPPPAAVDVRNDAGFDVDVYVDGAWRGEVARGDDRVLSTIPGHRQVTVRAAHDGLVLYDARMWLDPGRPSLVRLVPPTTRLTVVNRGDAPVLVSMTGCGESFWLLPGQRNTADVPSGRTLLTTSVYGRDGLAPVDHDDVTLAPGRSVTREVGFSATPAFSQVSLTNFESRTVRVYVDGREVAAIPPRSTRELQVASGSHMVTVAQDRGGLLYNAPVQFAPRTRFTVELRGGIHVAQGRPLVM